MAGGKLDTAKKQKADEFYTQLSDIEKELKNYKKHFKGKVIFCNCDDPETSNFYYYFVSNFDELDLKKLITTHFELDKVSYMLEYEGGANVEGDKETVVKRAIKLGKKKPLKQNFEQGGQGILFEDEPVRSYSGDFRSPECIELLKQSDIVVTNPPFSLFKEYVEQLIGHKKKFLIIGNINAISYKEIFIYIKKNKLWTGVSTFNQGLFFEVPEHLPCQKIENGKRLVRVSSVCWFTNLDHKKHHEDILLWANYDPKKYPKYDNYNAIEVSTYKDIPMDYSGLMGVPITFVDKYNPEQFEIIGLAADKRDEDEVFIKGKSTYLDEQHKNFVGMVLNGKATYARILVQNRKPIKRGKHEN
jgi:hypothetical protein